MLSIGIGQRRWWDFLLTMTEREIKSKYKFSVLGLFWIVLNPIIQMLVIGFVFRFFTSIKTEIYMMYLFSGLVVWNFFSSSVTRSTPAIVNERYLLKKAKFPRETIVLSIVLSNLVQLALSVVLMILIAIFLGVKISFAYLIFLPLSLLLIALFTAGFALVFSSLNVKYRDTSFVINFLVSIWFYATPVIYLLTMLPEWMSKWLYLNPMTGLIEFFRWIMLGLEVENWFFMCGNLFFALLTFVIGNYVFKRFSLDFDDWV
ncbi:MAG TPA: ABC transporter permease [Candidatus Methanoperedens sp.]|nr:ABC transporter permease [Candidatus Methanoperedens sp.]